MRVSKHFLMVVHNRTAQVDNINIIACSSHSTNVLRRKSMNSFIFVCVHFSSVAFLSDMLHCNLSNFDSNNIFNNVFKRKPYFLFFNRSKRLLWQCQNFNFLQVTKAILFCSRNLTSTLLFAMHLSSILLKSFSIGEPTVRKKWNNPKHATLYVKS